jgi:putative nucleotidyltransferase with HDIG domain
MHAKRARMNRLGLHLFTAYMLTVGLVGWGVLVWLSVRGPVYLTWEAGFFLALAILVGRHPVKLPRGPTTTVGFAVDYACLLIFGPAVVAWIGVISFWVLLRDSSWLRKLFNQGQVVLSFAGAGWVYQVLGGEYVEAGGPMAFGEMGLALVVGGVAYFCISSLLIAVGMALWERRSVGGMWALSFRWAAPRFLALAPFGLLMAMVYRTPGLGIWAVLLFLVPLVGARFAFQGAMETLELHRETVHALCNALEAYDPYTRNHSEVVTRYALAVGRELELPAQRMEVLEWACRLHDIGKCRQDWESIIRKPGKPSDREWEVIRQHPVEGSRLAEKMEFLPYTAGKVAQIVRAHHERLDGSGYPDRKRGEEIPLEARILGVADAFEAMTARRAYHRSRSAEEAIEEVCRCAGKQFDTEVVAALVALWERGELEVETSVEQQPAAGGVPLAAGMLASYGVQREAGGGGG